MAQSTHGLSDDAVTGAVSIGTVLAEPADPSHHEPRVPFRQLVITQTPPFHRPRPEVLNEHIAVIAHLEDEVPAFLSM